MRFLGNVIEKMQRHPKRVVFPEGAEPRILQAARQFHALRLGAPIVLGDANEIKDVAAGLKIPLEGIRIINPATSEDLENFATRLYRVRREKGLRQTEAREAMLQPNFYGAMMLAMHQADGLVSGASHITGSVLRPLFQIVRAAHPSIGKMQAATAQAKRKAAQLNVEADFDGEIQVDAALIPEIADRKLHGSQVAGRANVLIFPDLNSGNIASRLVQHIGRANAYGQILLGLNRPAADVSRGSSAHDILGVAAIVGVQATDYHKLYPGADKELPGE